MKKLLLVLAIILTSCSQDDDILPENLYDCECTRIMIAPRGNEPNPVEDVRLCEMEWLEFYEGDYTHPFAKNISEEQMRIISKQQGCSK